MAAQENWQIKKRGDICAGAGTPFVDGEEIVTRLSFAGGEYIREDYSASYWDSHPVEPGLSTWRSIFHLPPPPEEAVKKESAESLLRKLVAKEDADDVNAIYILAVMLERKKILAEEEVRTGDDQRKIRVYRHKKTEEVFLVTDPGLKLTELETVQEAVVGLLGGKPPKTETMAHFERLALALAAKYDRLLFPKRPVGGEEGIAQKLAACFLALLGGKKSPHREEADKVFSRFEDSEAWGPVIADYRELLERISREIRLQGLERPDFAKALEALALKEPEELNADEVLAAFAGDDPRIAGPREKVLAAVRTAAAHASAQ